MNQSSSPSGKLVIIWHNQNHMLIFSTGRTRTLANVFLTSPRLSLLALKHAPIVGRPFLELRLWIRWISSSPSFTSFSWSFFFPLTLPQGIYLSLRVQQCLKIMKMMRMVVVISTITIIVIFMGCELLFLSSDIFQHLSGSPLLRGVELNSNWALISREWIILPSDLRRISKKPSPIQLTLSGSSLHQFKKLVKRWKEVKNDMV